MAPRVAAWWRVCFSQHLESYTALLRAAETHQHLVPGGLERQRVLHAPLGGAANPSAAIPCLARFSL